MHIGIVVISLFPLFFPISAYPTPTSEIEKQLMCYCGCAMVLASCQCANAEKMRAEIQSKLDAGIPAQRIIQEYVAMHGEKVLSAPTKRGFNLTAWIAPFVAVAAGMMILYFLVREFVRRGKERLPRGEHPGEGFDEFKMKVDEELKDYL